MTGVESYVVAVDGSPTAAHGVSRLLALAFTAELIDTASLHGVRTIAIHELVTGEPRACWFRRARGWRALSVPGWLT